MGNEEICPLLDQSGPGQGAAKRYICYASGRLLGRNYLADYCLQGSNLGHEACPVLRPSDNAGLIAREHYERLKR